MTAEDFKNIPTRTIKYEFNQYVEKNHLSKHHFGEKKYEDQALALEDYQVFKKNYELRAEFANRYANCKAVVTDEEKPDCFGRPCRKLTYTETWDRTDYPQVEEIINLI